MWIVSAHDGHQASAAVQASYRIELQGAVVTPVAGLAYIHGFEQGFDETDASGFDLTVSSRKFDSLRTFAGVSTAWTVTTSGGSVFTPEVDIAWSHETKDAAPPTLAAVGGGDFIVPGITPARDLLTLGGGVTARASERLAFYLDYHATLPTGNLFSQTVSAGLRLRF